MTGMAQKNGAVLNHLRMVAPGRSMPAPAVGMGEAQLVVAFDLLAALSDESLRTMTTGTKVLGNDRVQSTAALNFNRDEHIDTSLLARRIEGRIGTDNASYVDATGIALSLCGDAIAANFFMVGVALQSRWLPLSHDAVEQAIRLNGVQVDFNLRALKLGRLWVHDEKAVRALLTTQAFAPHTLPELTLVLGTSVLALQTHWRRRQGLDLVEGLSIPADGGRRLATGLGSRDSLLCDSSRCAQSDLHDQRHRRTHAAFRFTRQQHRIGWIRGGGCFHISGQFFAGTLEGLHIRNAIRFENDREHAIPTTTPPACCAASRLRLNPSWHSGASAPLLDALAEVTAPFALFLDDFELLHEAAALTLVRVRPVRSHCGASRRTLARRELRSTAAPHRWRPQRTQP